MLGGTLGAAEASAPSSTILVLLLAAIAAVPGILSAITHLKSRKAKVEGDFGTVAAKLAFETLTTEVGEMREQARRWNIEREEWVTVKTALLGKINDITSQLYLTNSYLQDLLHELDRNDISRPLPPQGLLRPGESPRT